MESQVEPVVPVDAVNHPDHYTAHPSGVECIDIAEHLSFNAGSAMKYIWRAGEKGNAVEDFRKAAWYCEREAERIKEMEREDQSLRE